MNYWGVLLCFACFSPFLNPVTTLTHSPPLMTKQPANGESLFQVSTNTNNENEKPFIVECEAEGEPAPTYRWIKNGKNFSYETYDDRISQQPGRGTLVIKSPRDEDIGQYQCFAQNEFGVATSNSVFLRKAELNSFKDDHPQVINAKEGEAFKLNCQPPDGWPKPNVYWLIQGMDGNIRTINNSRMTVDPEGNLWFSNITKQDENENSMYACSASSVFRNEYKLGNKVVLHVLPIGSASSQNKNPPVAQYTTRRNEVAHRGGTATLFCIYGGTPLPETVWYKDGRPLPGTDRVSRGNYGKSLVIKYVTPEDEGDYQCEVSNGVGEAKSHQINLKVLAAPYFTEEPEIVNGAENETAEFHCRASGNPEPQIIWIYNGKPISEAPLNPRRTVKPNSIVIEKLQKSDTGNYGCNATNSIGYVYKDVYVNVLALAPDIIEKPRDEKTVYGRSCIITCRVVGSPKPAVKWVRNGIELTGGRYTTLPNGDLQISEVSFGDTGNYTCFAQNKIGNDSATGSLIVKHRTTISEGPVDYEVQAGSTATFRCSAQQDPDLVLTVDWLRNDEYINSKAEPRFVKMPDSSLTITKTTELDSGVYTCMASTDLDNATAKATLIVQDIPNAPMLVGHVECFAHEARLEWRPMGDNRAPILNYIIQYNTSFTPNSWDVALPSVPASESASTFPLTPWGNFTFRVLARNKIGLSPPSEHSSVCKTDDDVPHKNPSNVAAQGTEPTNLVITWTPMPQIEHHAPGFHYEVFWRLAAPGNQWTSQKITRWETSEYVQHNVPTFVRYEVKVTANNIRGQARIPAVPVFGYSGEDSPTEAPKNLTVVEVLSAKKANLTWYGVSPASVRGHLKGYKIQMWPEYDATKSRMKEITSAGNGTQIVIDKLTPNTKNLVRVLVFNGKYNGPPSEEVVIITPEGVPDAVQTVKAIPLGSSAFLLTWKPPLETNGALTGYLIHYQMLSGDSPALVPRKNQITDPTQVQAKLAGLKPGTKYRIYVNATTSAGAGESNYVVESTRGNSNSSPFKPGFDYSVVDTSIYVTLKIRWLPCGWSGSCGDQTAGTHFYVKYKMKGEPTYRTQTEIDEDYTTIGALEPGETYEFIVVSVDGDFFTESDAQDINMFMTDPFMQKKEHLATAGWFVAMILAIAFLIIVLILVCLVKRNRGGKYVVHEREAVSGRHDYPDEPGFREYSQPLGGVPRNLDSSNEKKPSPESDTDSMAEFAEGDTDGMNEDGSFIGQYGKKRNAETTSAGFATLV